MIALAPLRRRRGVRSAHASRIRLSRAGLCHAPQVKARWALTLDGTVEWYSLQPHYIDWTDIAEIDYTAGGQVRKYLRANCMRSFVIWPNTEE